MNLDNFYDHPKTLFSPCSVHGKVGRRRHGMLCGRKREIQTVNFLLFCFYEKRDFYLNLPKGKFSLKLYFFEKFFDVFI